MVLWEIASRQLPFSDACDDATVLVGLKMANKKKLPADTPSSYSAIVQKMWNKIPENRPAATLIVAELEKTKPSMEFSNYHAALRHFYGEDEEKRD